MAGRFKPITYAAVVFFLVAATAPLFVSSWATLFALILAKSIVVLGIILLLQAGQVSLSTREMGIKVVDAARAAAKGSDGMRENSA